MSDFNYVVNLAGVLSEESLGKLPHEERQRWEASWRKIDTQFGTQAKFLAKRGNWTRLSPSTMTSTCDAELTRESDDSIFVSGNPAPNDTYTIISVLDTGTITAFKLEVLTDPRLPNRGPGCHSSGNFFLSELILEAIPAKPGEAHHVPISQVWASFAGKNRPIRNVTDGDPATGWQVNDRIGKPQTAVFVLSQPIVSDGETRLSIRLQHDGDLGSGIGKFRLAVTSDLPPGN
jgi:hypothetical protein